MVPGIEPGWPRSWQEPYQLHNGSDPSSWVWSSSPKPPQFSAQVFQQLPNVGHGLWEQARRQTSKSRAEPEKQLLAETQKWVPSLGSKLKPSHKDDFGCQRQRRESVSLSLAPHRVHPPFQGQCLMPSSKATWKRELKDAPGVHSTQLKCTSLLMVWRTFFFKTKQKCYAHTYI